MGSRYSLVIAVAKRAKQLKNGAAKLVECKSKNPITIALAEIESGKLQVILPTQAEIEAISRRQEMPVQPFSREAAELLRHPKVSEVIDLEDDLDTDLAGGLDTDLELDAAEKPAEVGDEIEHSEDDEDPVPLDEMVDRPLTDEMTEEIESEE